MNPTDDASANDSKDEDSRSDTTNSISNATAEVPPKYKTDITDPDLISFYTKVLIAVCYLGEFLKAFAVFSLELFVIHAVAGFCTAYSTEFVLDRVSRIKFTASIGSIFVALIFDSYLFKVRYWAVVPTFLLVMVWPCLGALLASSAFTKNQEVKQTLFFWSSIFQGAPILFRAVRRSLIIEKAAEYHKITNMRRFIGLLVFSEMLGEFMAGLAIWIARESRMLYAGLMYVNIFFIALAAVCWVFWVRGYRKEKDTQFACVERALICSLCYFLKSIDRKCCRGLTHKKYPGWQEYRWFSFSERTANNAWTYLAMLLVLLPMVAYLNTNAGLYYMYICQSTNLHPENDEAFSVSATRAGFFCLFYPVLEYFFYPWIRRVIKNENVRLLVLMGVGMFLLGAAIFACAVIQQETAGIDRDVVNVVSLNNKEPFAHVVFVSLIDFDVQIRGKYITDILVEPAYTWRTLLPNEPFKILNVPTSDYPFNVTLSSNFFKIYDDYSIKLTPFHFNWVVVHPIGLFNLPIGTFHHTPQIGVHPKMSSPALVNVICRLPVCKGVLEFRQKGRYLIRSFFPGEGKTFLDLKTFRLSGEYEVSFAVVGNQSTSVPLQVYFERVRVYLLLIKENHIDPDGRSDMKTTVQEVQEVIVDSHKLWLLYLPPVFHGLALVFAEIAMWQWLHLISPNDMRCFMFTIPTLLTCIVYGIFSHRPASYLTTTSSIGVLSYGCGVEILLIIYGVTCLHFVRLWNRRHAATKKPTKHKRPMFASPNSNPKAF